MKTNIGLKQSFRLHLMKKNLTIPAASVKIAGLNGDDLEVNIGDGTIVLFLKEMDAEQLINAIEFLKNLSTELTVALTYACGQAEPAPISRFDLAEMSKFQSATPSFDFDTNYDANCVQLQAGPEGLLTVLRDSNVCLETLREMLQDERIIYG